MSSPSKGNIRFLYFACQAGLEATLAGVALTKPHPAFQAASAYISLAKDAPVGTRFTSTSALDDLRTSATFAALESLGSILSLATGDIPSSGWDISTWTPNFPGCAIFLTLLGSAKIASDKSCPTFLRSMSKAATKLRS